MAVLLQRPRAEEDLLEIWYHIARDNPSAADAMIEQLGATAWHLAENPEMGRSRPELLPGIRSFPSGNYILFYRMTEEGIELIRVLHASRDLDRLFKEFTP